MYKDIQPTDRDGVQKVYNQIVSVLGPDIVPFEDCVKMQQRNSEYIHGIFNQAGDVVGSYTMVPLIESAARAVGENALHGVDFKPDIMSEEGTQAAAYYLGSIAAHGQAYRRATVRAYLKRVGMLQKMSRCEVEYTRPVTDEGAVFAAKLGFQPVTD